MSWRWVLALVAAVCVSCSTAVSGSPSSDPLLPKIPPRPKLLQINEVDPCQTLTADQLRSLRVSFSNIDPPLETRGPTCRWVHSSDEPVEAYGVAVNTNGGVEVTFGTPQLEVVTIAGFGAVEVPAVFSTGKNDCIVQVDVAPRQALQVSYFYHGVTVPMTHEIACGKARNAAELAMKTVLAELGG